MLKFPKKGINFATKEVRHIFLRGAVGSPGMTADQWLTMRENGVYNEQ